jgi:hypothetical protein
MALTRSARIPLPLIVAFALAGTCVTGTQANRALQVPRPQLEVSHEARAVAPGEAVLLTFTSPGGIASVRGTAFGAPFVGFAGDSPSTWHALVGIDLDTRPGRAVVEVEARTVDGRSQDVLDAPPLGGPGVRHTSGGRAGEDRA